MELPGDGPPEPVGEESLPGQLETVVAHIEDLQVGPTAPRHDGRSGGEQSGGGRPAWGRLPRAPRQPAQRDTDRLLSCFSTLPWMDFLCMSLFLTAKDLMYFAMRLSDIQSSVQYINN